VPICGTCMTTGVENGKLVSLNSGGSPDFGPLKAAFGPKVRMNMLTGRRPRTRTITLIEIQDCQFHQKTLLNCCSVRSRIHYGGKQSRRR
jgi:hypothetical protein